MRKKGLHKVIEDFNVALEQGQAVVYRRNFDSDVYAYIGSYIKKITGYSADELTPAIWDTLLIRTEQKGELEGFSAEEATEMVRSGKVDRWQADVQIRTRSGEIRWVTDMSTVMHDRAGECIGVLLDITERKKAEKRLADLTEALRLRNQEIEADLAMAREVQQALVFQQPRSFPINATLDSGQIFFYNRYIPAEMLAGDFFEIIPISEHEVGVFICDVMGHGVRAALLTTFIRGLIQELTPDAGDPGAFLSRINNSLRAAFCQGGTLLFATAIYMVFDTRTGDLFYANAGHSFPLCLRVELASVEQLMLLDQTTEPALGIVEGFAYSTGTTWLDETDSLLLYTDGVFEMCNAEEQMYGEVRLMANVRKNFHLKPEARMDALIFDVLDFSGEEAFSDDVCLVSVVPTGRV